MNALTGPAAGLLVLLAVLVLVAGDLVAIRGDGPAPRRRALTVASAGLVAAAVALMVTRFLWLAV